MGIMNGVIPAEIAEEAAAIRATLVEAGPRARAVAASLNASGVRRIYVIGNGTSFHSSLAAATFFRRHVGPDGPVVLAYTGGEFSHYPPALGPGDVVVGISASGEFRDVIDVTNRLRDQIPTVAIVHVPGSTLDRIAHYVVRSAGGQSSSPVMTKTFVATLTAAQLLLVAFLGADTLAVAERAMMAAADDVEAAVAQAAARVDEIADALINCEHWFVVGSGNAAAAALEAALKLKEIALVHAEGAESWEMATGGATIVGPGTAIVALAPNGPGRDAVLDFAQHAASWGAQVVEVGPGPAVLGGHHLPLPAAATEDLAPLTAVAPVALLAYTLACRRGVNPDHPGWIDRYHSQGLRHIVGV